MKHFIVYAISTGDILRSGICQDEDFERQARPDEGEAVMEATADAIVVAEINLGPVRDALYRQIDEAAEACRSLFITPGSGQAITYLRKEDEAAAWQADNNTPTPILSAEAAAVGMSVADLAAEVLANAQLWLEVGTKIEAARRGAKKAIELTDNIAEMHAAAQIDWQAALA